jgi:hypothetical protein
VRRALVNLQVFGLMCLPLPQAAYAAVALGGRLGLDIGSLLTLYALSDVLAFLVIGLVLRRLGPAAMQRARRYLPRHVDARLQRSLPAGTVALGVPAMFAAGYANLYLAAVVSGLGRSRFVTGMAFGIAGDLVQFTGTVMLASALAKALPFQGADMVLLLVLPAALAAASFALRSRGLSIDRLRVRRSPLDPALVPVPVRVEER